MVPVLLQQGNPMTKLTDIQLVILTAAYQRPNRLVLPLPERPKGGAAQKVVGALLLKDLVEEVLAGAGDPVWRQPADGHAVTLVATTPLLRPLASRPPAGSQRPPRARQRQASPWHPPRDHSRQRVAQRR